MINHGTRGGYYAHLRQSDERPVQCEPCREAINAYVKAYRAKKGMSRNRELDRIRRSAMATLRDRHRAEYEALVEQGRREMQEIEESLI